MQFAHNKLFCGTKDSKLNPDLKYKMTVHLSLLGKKSYRYLYLVQGPGCSSDIRKSGQLEGPTDLVVCVSATGVQVETQRAGEQDRLLHREQEIPVLV
jgi:hypothetical protein